MIGNWCHFCFKTTVDKFAEINNEIDETIYVTACNDCHKKILKGVESDV